MSPQGWYADDFAPSGSDVQVNFADRSDSSCWNPGGSATTESAPAILDCPANRNSCREDASCPGCGFSAGVAIGGSTNAVEAEIDDMIICRRVKFWFIAECSCWRAEFLVVKIAAL